LLFTESEAVAKGLLLLASISIRPLTSAPLAATGAKALSGPAHLLAAAESYTWLNPHLSLRLVWNGDVKINVEASNPTWAKWLPSWPTSAHWYDRSRFRRYMAAHIAHRGDVTVRESGPPPAALPERGENRRGLVIIWRLAPVRRPPVA
jgi:hypothetical protein